MAPLRPCMTVSTVSTWDSISMSRAVRPRLSVRPGGGEEGVAAGYGQQGAGGVMVSLVQCCGGLQCQAAGRRSVVGGGVGVHAVSNARRVCQALA